MHGSPTTALAKSRLPPPAPLGAHPPPAHVYTLASMSATGASVGLRSTWCVGSVWVGAGRQSVWWAGTRDGYASAGEQAAAGGGGGVAPRMGEETRRCLEAGRHPVQLTVRTRARPLLPRLPYHRGDLGVVTESSSDLAGRAARQFGSHGGRWVTEVAEGRLWWRRWWVGTHTALSSDVGLKRAVYVTHTIYHTLGVLQPTEIAPRANT